jgi:CubicO group peptidase (beta-lactamase class C family)
MKPKFLLLFIGLILSQSCDKQTSTLQPQETGTRLISNAYQIPVFDDDQRIEKIKEIIPELQSIFDEHLADHKIPGIAYGIVVDDTLVVSSTSGVLNIESSLPVSTSSLFRIASMTKSFTALAILKLRDEGYLSLDDPVSRYITELATLEYLTSDSPIIDIENLLTMTAGFPEDNPWGDRQLAISDQAFLDLIARGLSLSNISSYQYEYSNTGYALLGRIITVVSKIPYQEYIQRNILNPLGMNNTYWEYSNIPVQQMATGYRWEDEKWKQEPILHDGAYGAMGGLITSIEDFSKYVQFHLSAWPPRSGEETGPLKRSSVREMHNPQFNFLNPWDTDWNDEPCTSMIGYGYGLGISMNCKRMKRVSHGGALPGYGSNYAFFPEYGIGLMAFGNLTYTSPIPYDKIEKMLFETLDLQPRQPPASDILKQRKEEILTLIKQDELTLDSNIFADNFFLDRSMESRTNEIKDILSQSGTVKMVQKVVPRNQLRGDFNIECANGNISIFFTLTPENIPKIQRLDISFQPNE